jgi:hypothetical protein
VKGIVMNTTKKLELAKLLTMQSDQLNKLLDKFEGKIPDLVAGATTDQKLAFYAKVNNIYTEKRSKLHSIVKE